MKDPIKVENSRLLIRQIIRYLVVGGMATMINYMIFYFLYKLLGIHFLISSSLGFILSVLVGYFFNKRWTFNHADRTGINVFRYFLVYFFSLVLSIFLLKISVHALQMLPEYANILAICVTVCTNFLGLKYLVFKRPRS